MRNGASVFSQFNFTEKLGLWFRIDQVWSDFTRLDSKVDDEFISKWLKRDGLYAFTGVEYIIVPKHLRASVNYQHHTPDTSEFPGTDFIYFNVEVKW
jgi:hypothetical protein